MSASGAIYVAIVGAWAAYLVPRCMRRPDELPGLRPVDDLPASSRVLTRRVRRDPVERRRRGGRSRREAHYWLLRPRPAVGSAPVVKKRRTAPAGPDRSRTDGSRYRASHSYGPHPYGPAPYGPPYPSVPPVPRPRAAPVSRVTLARRRRALTLLALAAAAGVWSGAAGQLPVWAAGLPVLLLVTYVAELRAQVRRRRAVGRRQRPSQTVAKARRRRADLPARRENGRPGRQEFDREAAAGPVPSAADVGVGDVAVEDGWRPVAVPLPTYVTASPAPMPARRIDVPPDVAWTSAQDIAADATEIQAVPASAVVEAPLERRAVND
jgi:hypothetical protein